MDNFGGCFSFNADNHKSLYLSDIIIFTFYILRILHNFFVDQNIKNLN